MSGIMSEGSWQAPGPVPADPITRSLATTGGQSSRAARLCPLGGAWTVVRLRNCAPDRADQPAFAVIEPGHPQRFAALGHRVRLFCLSL